MQYHIGTSGWSYNHWKKCYYEGIKRADWLPYHSRQFETIELNSSFYRVPRIEYLEKWDALTPSNFIFSIKVWREITHYKRLKNCEVILPAFIERMQMLGEKCGPFLFQLPGSVKRDIGLLRSFLQHLPPSARYCFEFRDKSWWCDEVYQLLADHHIAFTSFEIADVISPRISTTDFIYIRLHGRSQSYYGNYEDDELRDWANWLRKQNRETFIYFDNTADECNAVDNARSLWSMLNRSDQHLVDLHSDNA